MQRERKFLNHIYAPNSSQLGRTERAGGANQYHFNGDIDFAEVYRNPLSDQALMDITGVTGQIKYKIHYRMMLLSQNHILFFTLDYMIQMLIVSQHYTIRWTEPY